MRRLVISQDYLMKRLGLVLLFGFISLGAIGGCSNNGSGQVGTRALTENGFANDESLRGDPQGGVIVTFLEHPDSEIPENDTNGVGTDEIPIKYNQTLEHTICWEDEDADAMHFMELKDSEGNEVLRVDVNGDCVTEIIEEGNYIMTYHHDGRIETSHPIFIIPDPEKLQQARETDGLINRFKVVVANILKGIEKTVTKDAQAQTIQDNINTLLSTNSCVGCDLTGVIFGCALHTSGCGDLSGANLTNANLSKSDLEFVNLSDAILTNANLSESDSEGCNFSGANLTDANLFLADLFFARFDNAVLLGASLRQAKMSFAELPGANLIGAVMGDVDLSNADLSGVNLNGARLNNVDLSNADLSNADLSDADLTLLGLSVSGADLRGANLIGAYLSGADLSSVTWCNSCKCADPSIGTCVGCPSVGEVCTGS